MLAESTGSKLPSISEAGDGVAFHGGAS